MDMILLSGNVDFSCRVDRNSVLRLPEPLFRIRRSYSLMKLPVPWIRLYISFYDSTNSSLNELFKKPLMLLLLPERLSVLLIVFQPSETRITSLSCPRERLSNRELMMSF